RAGTPHGMPDSAADLVPPRPTLPKLRETAADCRACPLWKGATQTVFGAGGRAVTPGPRLPRHAASGRMGGIGSRGARDSDDPPKRNRPPARRRVPPPGDGCVRKRLKLVAKVL